MPGVMLCALVAGRAWAGAAARAVSAADAAVTARILDFIHQRLRRILTSSRLYSCFTRLALLPLHAKEARISVIEVRASGLWSIGESNS